MKKLFLVVLGIVAIGHMAMAEEVTFNYEGRIKVSGQTYTGTGYFKLAIINNNHQITLWSNDGTSAAGDEPTSAFIADVTDGVFNIAVGDTSIVNMEAINPAVFNADEKVYLRVWFSDTGSDFEMMRPDRQIANPALLGIQTADETTIYVDSLNGDDRYTGLEEDRPKKTIQAAWNSIPSLVQSYTRIQLASGVYREAVLLTGKTTIGDATIEIRGDPESPDNYRVTGSEAAADTTPVKDYCFNVKNQEGVEIVGILANYAGKCINVNDTSDAVLRACKINNYSVLAVEAIGQARCKLYDLIISDSLGTAWPRAVSSDTSSAIYLKDTEIFNITGSAAYANRTSSLNISGCYFHDCTAYGVYVAGGSIATFGANSEGGPSNIIENVSTGVGFRMGSIGWWPNLNVQYINVGLAVQRLDYSVIDG